MMRSSFRKFWIGPLQIKKATTTRAEAWVGDSYKISLVGLPHLHDGFVHVPLALD
jgi:hypothetical protein